MDWKPEERLCITLLQSTFIGATALLDHITISPGSVARDLSFVLNPKCFRFQYYHAGDQVSTIWTFGTLTSKSIEHLSCIETHFRLSRWTQLHCKLSTLSYAFQAAAQCVNNVLYTIACTHVFITCTMLSSFSFRLYSLFFCTMMLCVEIVFLVLLNVT